MAKFYIAAMLICFVLTVGVMGLIALDCIYEEKKTRLTTGNSEKLMTKKDKWLMIPKIILFATLVSIPAPLTLLAYALMCMSVLFQPET